MGINVKIIKYNNSCLVGTLYKGKVVTPTVQKGPGQVQSLTVTMSNKCVIIIISLLGVHCIIW